jgi:ankyrin repeat protein
MLLGCASAMTPLHEAALSGNTEVVKEWIAKKRNLDPTWDEPSRGLEGNYARLKGLTPLMMAARAGQLEIARLLVDGGANVYAEANTQLPGEPRTAFDFAVEGNHVAVAEYIWSKSDRTRLGRRLAQQIAASCSRLCNEKAGGDEHTNMALFLIGVARDRPALGKGIGEAACYAARPLELLAFVEKRVDRIPGGALHCMAFQTQSRQRPAAERLAVVTWLLDHGADPNDRSSAWTPLMGAATAHDVEMVKLLLARGANPNLVNADGLTPIGAAADSCVNVPSADTASAQLEAQSAMVQFLAGVSDRAVYASPAARSKLGLLAKCCAREVQAPAQRRICEPFGL